MIPARLSAALEAWAVPLEWIHESRWTPRTADLRAAWRECKSTAVRGVHTHAPCTSQPNVSCRCCAGTCECENTAGDVEVDRQRNSNPPFAGSTPAAGTIKKPGHGSGVQCAPAHGGTPPVANSAANNAPAVAGEAGTQSTARPSERAAESASTRGTTAPSGAPGDGTSSTFEDLAARAAADPCRGPFIKHAWSEPHAGTRECLWCGESRAAAPIDKNTAERSAAQSGQGGEPLQVAQQVRAPRGLQSEAEYAGSRPALAISPPASTTHAGAVERLISKISAHPFAVPLIAAARQELAAKDAELEKAKFEYKHLREAFDPLCPNHASNADLAPHFLFGDDFPRAFRRLLARAEQAERARAEFARMSNAAGEKAIKDYLYMDRLNERLNAAERDRDSSDRKLKEEGDRLVAEIAKRKQTERVRDEAVAASERYSTAFQVATEQHHRELSTLRARLSASVPVEALERMIDDEAVTMKGRGGVDHFVVCVSKIRALIAQARGGAA